MRPVRFLTLALALSLPLVGCAGHHHHHADAALSLRTDFAVTATTSGSAMDGFDANGGPLVMDVDAQNHLTVTTLAGPMTINLSAYPSARPVGAGGGYAYLVIDGAQESSATDSVVVVRLSDGTAKRISGSTFAAVGGSRAVLLDETTNTYHLYDAAAETFTALNLPTSVSVSGLAGDDLLTLPVARSRAAKLTRRAASGFSLYRTDGTKLTDYDVPDGANALIIGLNSRGLAVGIVLQADNSRYPVEWSASGQATRLPGLAGYDVEPTSISDAGLIFGAGAHQASNATSTPYVRIAYRGGKLIQFDSPASTNIFDFRISANGQGVVLAQGPTSGAGTPTFAGLTPN